MTHPHSILIYGHDLLLLDTRRWLLEKSGFEVNTLSALQAVIAVLTSEVPSLVILCHTLKPDERRSVSATAASIQPPVKILSFRVSGPFGEVEETYGETLHDYAGPEGLIAAARKILE